LSLPFEKIHDGDVEGFVLAGGRSSRMGQEKALMQLAGIPLIRRSLQILLAAQVNPQIAGAGSNLFSFAPVIPDDPQHGGLGPLSGVCSALSATKAKYGVFLPVDMPLVPAGLISYLIEYASVTESAVTTVSAAGFVQTFPAVIDTAAGPALRASLRSNDRKCLTAFQTAAKSVECRFSILPLELLLQAGQISQADGVPPTRWFLNVNTAEDMTYAESLLRSRHQLS
jgi:molybdopterin-guanine dinucleotide biosynthesis protein A